MHSSKFWYDLRVSYGANFVKHVKISPKLKVIKRQHTGMEKARQVLKEKLQKQIESKSKGVKNLKQFKKIK